MTINKQLEIGQLYFTQGLSYSLEDNFLRTAFVMDCLQRHKNGDWGDMVLEDKLSNDEAFATGHYRVFSSYSIPEFLGIDDDDRIWIITEWDRSCTTIMFPWEY